jgi:predicted nucleic acid-binding Zn ribbon protein
MPALLAVPATCLGCDRPIPAGVTWCSWPCRNVDDRHDDAEFEAVDD